MDRTSELTSARQRLGLTQTELAERWGVDIATIWRWENRGVPKRGAAQVLVTALIAEVGDAQHAALASTRHEKPTARLSQGGVS